MLKKTPLNGVHRELGARMVDFGGWDMPVQYSGVVEEHLATRQAAGLFDVSHMGEVEVRGNGALAFIQHLTINDAARLVDGQVQYSAMCYPHGGVVDDVTLYRLKSDHYLFCVNASNTDKDFSWMQQILEEGYFPDVGLGSFLEGIADNSITHGMHLTISEVVSDKADMVWPSASAESIFEDGFGLRYHDPIADSRIVFIPWELSNVETVSR